MNYWLMKTEPGVYSIDDLRRDGHTAWEGVRNFQARNFLRDAIKKGDEVLFYHSNAEPSGVAGTGRIKKEGTPDSSALDKKDIHFDSRSTREKPIWFMVDVEFTGKFKNFIPLEALKSKKKLSGMLVTQRGSRLSVQPVTRDHFETVVRMGQGQS